MDVYQVIGAVIVLTTLLNYANRRVLHLHPTIGMLLAGAIVAGVVAWGDAVGASFAASIRAGVKNLQFNDLLLQGMLGFLLFAGARQINLKRLLNRLWPISVFALGGVVFSAFLIAAALSVLSDALGLGLTFLDCLLFGAIISPTDPIAVLSILRQVGAPKDLEMDVEGESLFNDGIGVVMFLVVVKVMTSPGDVGVGTVMGLFALEAAGGVLMGFAFGFVASRLIRTSQDSKTQLLLTLCIATGGYQLAGLCRVSGPLAMVVAGIVVGNHKDWVEPACEAKLDAVWGLIDEVGNAILFMLVGLELALVAHLMLPEWHVCLVAGLIAIPVVLLARGVALAGPMWLLRWQGVRFSPGALRIMTWGGLRGGLPLAMALCIPTQAAQMSGYDMTRDQTVDRAMLLMMTYCVVLFSIIPQGLTIKPLVQFFGKDGKKGE